MENVIYILIGLGWLIFSLYKSNQKKASRKVFPASPLQPSGNQGSARVSPKKELDVSDFIEQLFKTGDEMQAENIPDISYQRFGDLNPPPPPADEIKPEPLLKKIRTGYESVEYSDQRAGDTKAGNKEEVTEKKDIRNGEIFSFNLRQAVIHQAILNRPYS